MNSLLEPFGMAGVWSSWKYPKTGQCEPTFAILTGDANGVMQPVHDRQPTILVPRDYEEWLAYSDRPPIHLLRLLPNEDLKSKLIQAVDERTNKQASLFDGL